MASAISGSWIGAISSSAQISTDISGSFTEASSGLASRIASTEAGSITGVTAGTGLSGGGSSGAVTVNVDFSDSTFQSGISGSWQVPLSGVVSSSVQLTTDSSGILVSSSAQLASAISGSWIGAVSSSTQLSTDISGSWQGWASSSAEHTFGGDIRVAGNVLAENYIVSSSVMYMTQSFSSGSTIFGNTPDDTHVFTGSLIVSSSIGIDVQHGNISGSYTSTGSFGRIEASVIGGLSPIRIESDTFTVDATGGVSGSGESTGSFGRVQAEMMAGEVQVTTGSLTGEMWITTNTGSRMFIGKSTRGIKATSDSGSDIDVGQTVDGTDVGFSTVHSGDSSSIYLTTGDGIVLDEQNHWYTDRKFHIGGDSQFIRFDGVNSISMSAQMFPQTGSFGGQMWVNTSDTDRMYIGKYAGGFTVAGDDDPVNISRYATDEYGNTIDVGFYLNESGSIVGLSDGDGIKVNNYNYWYTNRQFAVGTSSQYIRYNDNNLFEVSLGSAAFTSITSSGNISSSATGSFGRIEATTISASTISVNAATLNVGNQTINQTIAGNIQNVSPGAISGSWQVPLSGAVSSSVQLASQISGSFTAVSSSLAGRITTREAFTTQSFLDGTADLVSGSAVSTGSFGALRIDNKLGIGTTSPSSPLHVKSSAADLAVFESDTLNREIIIKNTASTPNGTISSIRWQAKDSAGNNTTYAQFSAAVEDDTNGGEDGSLKFYTTKNGTMAERVKINEDGFVGIGMTDPNNHLMVGGATGGDIAVARIDTSINDGDTLGNILFKGKDDGGGSAYGIGARMQALATETWNEATAEGTSLNFYTTDNGTAVHDLRMTIDHNGNLGIGTTNPEQMLQVKNGKVFFEHNSNFGQDANQDEVLFVNGKDDITAAFHTDSNAVGDHAGIGFGVWADNYHEKGAIFFERLGSYGYGRLKFAVDSRAASNTVTPDYTVMQIDSGSVHITSSFGTAANLLVDGNISGSSSSTGSFGQLTLPQKDTAANPTINFGDGDTGFYEGSDDSLRISIAGTYSYLIDAYDIRSTATRSFLLDKNASSATNPAFAFNGDPNTGLGSSDADNLSLTTGGVEQLRIASNTISGSSTSTGSFGYSYIDKKIQVGGVNETIAGVNIQPDAHGYLLNLHPDGGVTTTNKRQFSWYIANQLLSLNARNDSNANQGTIIDFDHDGDIMFDRDGRGATFSGSSVSTGSFGRVEATTFAGDGAALTNVPDYVFESDYNLKPLNELETFVSQSKHLPNVPSVDDAPEWAKYTVGDRDMLLLEKIEELSLYIIELHKRVESLESQLPTNNPNV